MVMGHAFGLMPGLMLAGSVRGLSVPGRVGGPVLVAAGLLAISASVVGNGGGLAFAPATGGASLAATPALASLGVSGVAAVGAGVVLMMGPGDRRNGDAKGPQDKGRPRSNIAQNNQARDAIRQYEHDTGRELTADQVRQAHDEFGRHGNANYQELIEILRDSFGE